MSDEAKAVADAAKHVVMHEFAALVAEVKDEVGDLAEELEGAAAEIAADMARVAVAGADPAMLAELRGQAQLVLERRRIRLSTKGRKRLESFLTVTSHVLGTVLAVGLRAAVGRV